MNNELTRTEALIGFNGITKLKNARVAVFGIGGVGGYVAEALARSGVGTIGLIDNDTVDITNINRQIIATHKTIGKLKTEVMAERIAEINPEIAVKKYNIFFSGENANQFDFESYDYIVDAIDTVTSKLLLVMLAKENNIPIISSMGTGNKLEASMLEIADIFKTSVCPLARVMRYELKKRGIKKLKVVYSKEEPIKSSLLDDATKKTLPASCAFVPAAAGLIIAGEVVKDLINS